ncbi:zinc finger protein 251-like isoform X1 [Channa argus]|uniref:zinc finger protein 251-like isoform X1 n=1 Tax=Channa argus TaxID=215402 RepID=UPI0035228A2E
MATATLQSFNVFLTERLTAAAVDIYGFVEKTVTNYQEEVYRAKMENERLQRLLDLVYKPEIRLHRADSRQMDLPAPTQEVCDQEQQTQMECILNEAKEETVTVPFKVERTEAWPRSVEMLENSILMDTQIVTVGKHEENLIPVVTVGKQSEAGSPYSLTQVKTGGDKNEISPLKDPPLPLLGESQLCTKKKVFHCNICPQSFVKNVELKHHLASHATKGLTKPTNKDLTCFVCGRITDTRSQMICHMRAHTGEKPYDCPLCGNRYKLKCHMKEHLRTHTGERPFTCYICGRCFNRSSTMRKHARIKHMDNEPFKCTECSECFPRLVLFKRHMKGVHNITFSV